MNLKLYKCFIVLLLMLIITACNKSSESSTMNYFNPEMIGHWTNDQGCAIDFIRDGDYYLVKSFTDGKSHQLDDVLLYSEKISIMTKFKSQDNSIKFSGSFAEGLLIIDKYCKDPLHKISY